MHSLVVLGTSGFTYEVGGTVPFSNAFFKADNDVLRVFHLCLTLDNLLIYLFLSVHKPCDEVMLNPSSGLLSAGSPLPLLLFLFEAC